MDDKERFTAWLEIQEKYRLLEEEWRNHRRGKVNASSDKRGRRQTEEETASAGSPDAGNLPTSIT